MTPEQKLKKEIILRTPIFDDDIDNNGNKITIPKVIDQSNVDNLYKSLFNMHLLCEISPDVRRGDFETNINPEYSRHYESKSVGIKCADGSFIGWTYWYGGGKFGDPESIDWISEAYDLKLIKEEEVRVIHREWEKC